MKNKLNCRQVAALINFYNEGCLTDLLTKYVEEHLDNCPECREKYFFQNIEEIVPEENSYTDEQYENFLNNLSPYIDNELSDAENIKIKKYVIQNPKARKVLEDMYIFKKNLHLAHEKTKTDFKSDLSKDIINKIFDKQKANKHYFYKLAAAFFVTVIFLITGLFKFLHL
ncbi:zf-HC2 domain-containing protein [bacterium]|nr:zf-HC2 domain-containing protein [bacterium]